MTRISNAASTLKLLSLVIFVVTGSLFWQLVSLSGNGNDTLTSPSQLDAPRELCKKEEPVKKEAIAATVRPAQTQEPIANSCQAEYERSTSNTTRGLTLDDLEQSRALIGNRHRLAFLSAKLQDRQEPVNAIVCGGSITIGHGVVP